jgi:RimJ/RimL family protein N-acetyltransferase
MDIRLRNISLTDKKDLLAWRNDPFTRKMSFNSEIVAASEHEAWFNKIICDKERIFYIGENKDGEKVGVVSFYRIVDETYEINVNIAPAYRGRGLGTALISEGVAFIMKQKEAKKIKARIKSWNTSSIMAFTKSGFIKSAEKDNVMEMYFGG